MWALALKLLGIAVGFFFPAKDERDEERKAGQDLGNAQAGRAAAEGQLNDIAMANQARNSVSDDADDILRDPANQGAAGGGPRPAQGDTLH